MVEYVRYHCTRRLHRLPLSEQLRPPQPSGIREALTIAGAVAPDKAELGETAPATCQEVFRTDQGEVGETASATCQEVFRTDQGEVGETASAAAQEVYTSLVPDAAERQSGRFSPSSCHCQALYRGGYGRELRRGRLPAGRWRQDHRR